MTDELQEQIVLQLREHEDLAGLEIVHEELKDLVNQITLGLKKLGLVIVVTSPTESCSNINLPEPVYDNVTVKIQIIENVLINRSANGTQQPCKRIAKAVVDALWHFRPAGFGSALYAGTPLIHLVSDQSLLIYRVTMKLGT